MDEIRKDNIAQIELKSGKTIEGKVVDFESDRVLINIYEAVQNDAKELKELDEVMVNIYTHLGLKKMKSAVITALNKEGNLLIENNKTIPPDVQKREFVRVISDFSFFAQGKPCTCINISAGGIAFSTQAGNFSKNDIIDIKFDSTYFEKDIITKAVILKVVDNTCCAKYIGLNPYDEDRIVKYVFKLISEK